MEHERPGPEGHAAALRLCGEAATLAAQGERSLALASFLEAWELLPEPKDDSGLASVVRGAARELVRDDPVLARAVNAILGARPEPRAPRA